METLTNDMTRLRAEIATLRAARMSMMKDIQNAVIRNRSALEAMTAEFRTQHARVAKRGKSERLAFLSGVSRQVSGIRKETDRLRNAFRADIMGGHKAWFAAAGGPEVPQREGRKKKAA